MSDNLGIPTTVHKKGKDKVVPVLN